MKKLITPILVTIAFFIFITVSGTIYVVNQKQFAVITQFGAIKRVIKDPGLYFKFPILQDVNILEKRIITLDEKQPTNIITQEKNFLLVDTYAKWRISDPGRFYERVRTVGRAQQRISQVINAKLREEFGRNTLQEVIAEKRDGVMQNLFKLATEELKEFGLEVVDVRLKKVELPDTVLDSTYERMKAERLRVANELRSTGAAKSEKIRAEADRESRVILADAYKLAEQTRGEGDSKATEVYANAYLRDPEFYSFYKSMSIYSESLGKNGDLIVLDPNSKFLKHYK